MTDFNLGDHGPRPADELMDVQSRAVRVLSTPSPAVTEDHARYVAREFYNLNVSATLMAGERDRNFLLNAGRQGKSVLKVYNAADDEAVREFQHGVLLHIERHAALCFVPRLIPTCHGDREFHAHLEGESQVGVLISYIDGVNAETVTPTTRMRWNIGRTLAQVATALSSYEHECAHRVLLWDLLQVHHLRALLPCLRKKCCIERIETFIESFEQDALIRARSLPQQIIHNDATSSNILLSRRDTDEVVGIIDFGDMVYAPAINDVAVAASYFSGNSGDIGADVADMINGYDTVRTVSEEELDLLPELLMARLVVRVLLNEWRSQLFPENRRYIQRNSDHAWTLLESVSCYAPGELGESIRRNRTKGL